MWLLLCFLYYINICNSLCENSNTFSPLWFYMDLSNITGDPDLGGVWYLEKRWDVDNNCTTYLGGEYNTHIDSCTYKCQTEGDPADYTVSPTCTYSIHKSPIFKLAQKNYYAYWKMDATTGTSIIIVSGGFTTICEGVPGTDNLLYTISEYTAVSPKASWQLKTLSYLDNNYDSGVLSGSYAPATVTDASNNVLTGGEFRICDYDWATNFPDTDQCANDTVYTYFPTKQPTVVPTINPTIMPTTIPTINPTPSPTLPKVKYDIKRHGSFKLRNFNTINVTIDAYINLDKTINFYINGPWNYSYGIVFAKTDIFSSYTTFEQIFTLNNILQNNNASGYMINPYLSQNDENFLFEFFGYDIGSPSFSATDQPQNSYLINVDQMSNEYTNIIVGRNSSNMADMNNDFNFADFANLVNKIYVCYISTQLGKGGNVFDIINPSGGGNFFGGDCDNAVTGNCFGCSVFDFDGNYQIQFDTYLIIDNSNVSISFIYDPYALTLKGTIIKDTNLYIMFGGFYDYNSSFQSPATSEWYHSFIWTVNNQFGYIVELTPSPASFSAETGDPKYVESVSGRIMNFSVSTIDIDAMNNGWDTIKFLQTGEMTVDIYWQRTDNLFVGNLPLNENQIIRKHKLILVYNTDAPTLAPSMTPSVTPTSITRTPTLQTKTPTNVPSTTPTKIPTSIPSITPTLVTSHPTSIPTSIPTTIPSQQPSNTPTILPTINPSMTPSMTPSSQTTMIPPTGKPTGLSGKTIGIIAGSVGGVILIIIVVILILGCVKSKEDDEDDDNGNSKDPKPETDLQPVGANSVELNSIPEDGGNAKTDNNDDQTKPLNQV